MKTVLIVDDNATLAYFTANSLRQDIQGIDVLIAASCQEARNEAARVLPAVMLVDIRLPDGDGRDLIHEFRERYPGIVPIVTSADEPMRGIENKCFGFLRKPYGTARVVSLVRQALGQSNPTDLTISDDGDDRPKLSPPLAYDRHYVRNRFAGLLAGLRALQADLQGEAHDPSAVRHLAGEDVDRLFGIALELADIVKQNDSALERVENGPCSR